MSTLHECVTLPLAPVFTHGDTGFDAVRRTSCVILAKWTGSMSASDSWEAVLFSDCPTDPGEVTDFSHPYDRVYFLTNCRYWSSDVDFMCRMNAHAWGILASWHCMKWCFVPRWNELFYMQESVVVELYWILDLPSASPAVSHALDVDVNAEGDWDLSNILPSG